MAIWSLRALPLSSNLDSLQPTISQLIPTLDIPLVQAQSAGLSFLFLIPSSPITSISKSCVLAYFQNTGRLGPTSLTTHPGQLTLNSVVHNDSSYPAPTYSNDNIPSWFPRLLLYSSLFPFYSVSMRKIRATCGFNFHFYSCFKRCMYNNGGTTDSLGRYVAEYSYFNGYDSTLICIRETITTT